MQGNESLSGSLQTDAGVGGGDCNFGGGDHYDDYDNFDCNVEWWR
jgi:hypothetical protein